MAFYRKSTERHTFSAYDHADTVLDAVRAYSRCRRSQAFILTDGSRDLDRYACSSCGLPLSTIVTEHPEGYHGNRCEYSPSTHTFTARHYTCSWGATLDAICTSSSVAEAGRKLILADAKGRHAAPTPRTGKGSGKKSRRQVATAGRAR